MDQKNLLKGTAILTVAGLITRLLGFFYRIFLADVLGATRLGMYQLVFPLYGICYTIFAAGLQTAISQLVAAKSNEEKKDEARRILFLGVVISLVCSVLLGCLVFVCSDFIAMRFLLEPACAASLRILALAFPFCGLTACINGFFYGQGEAAVPAGTQLLEQVVRIVCVFLLSVLVVKETEFPVEYAVIGLVFGEIASCLYSLIRFWRKQKRNRLSITHPKDKISVIPASSKKNKNGSPFLSHSPILKCLLALSIPLTLNRLLINLLHSFESVLIPGMLRRFGMSAAQALAEYGILNGMVIPFLVFPGTITGSLSVLLLPTIAKADAEANRYAIRKASSLSLIGSLLLGLAAALFFLFFGKPLGMLVFKNETAGRYLCTIACLAPIMYTSTTLGSIIGGLGKTHITVLYSVLSQALRLILFYILVPVKGMNGCFIGMIVSGAVTLLLESWYVWKHTK